MDDNTKEVIANLATKLGVTAEHLWGVLIAQARIDFYVTTVQYAIIAAGVYGTFRYWRWFQKQDRIDDGWAFMGIGITVITTIFAVCAFLTFSTYLASAINPEFWALYQVLTLIKSK